MLDHAETCCCALEPSLSRSRMPRGAARLPDRLSQHRMSDPDHTHRRRAQARLIKTSRSPRCSGNLLTWLRNLRKWRDGDRRRTRRCAAEKKGAGGGAVGSEKTPWDKTSRADRRAKEKFGKRPRSASAEATSRSARARRGRDEEAMAGARADNRCAIDKGWRCARCAACQDLANIVVKQGRKLRFVFARRPRISDVRHHWALLPVEASRCRAGGACASRCGCFHRSERSGHRQRCSVPGGRKFLIESLEGKASSFPRTRSRYDAQGQAGAQRKAARRGARELRRRMRYESGRLL